MPTPILCSQCGAPAHISESGEGPFGGIVPALQRCYPLCERCFRASLLVSPCEQCCGDDCECSCHDRKEAHADPDPVRP